MRIFQDALKWGKPLYDTLKSFTKDVQCQEHYNENYSTFIKLFNKYETIKPATQSSIHYNITINHPSTTTVGEVFRVLYTINHRGGERLIVPTFNGISIVRGPIKTNSLKNGNIDGNKVSEEATTYYYDLKAEYAGTFEIPPISIIIDERVYRSKSFVIDAFNVSETFGKKDRATNTRNINNEHNSTTTETPIKKGGKNGSINIIILLILILGGLAFIIGSIHHKNEKKPLSTETIIKQDTIDSVDVVYDNYGTYDDDAESLPTYEIVYYKTGDKPYQAFYGRGKYDSNTSNSLFIKNGSYCDAVVFLETLNGKKTRHVYIRKDETFTMTQIPGGKYIIKIMQGNSWCPDKYNGEGAPEGGFMEDFSISQSEYYDPFDYPYPESGRYYEYEVTLYKVQNGNMHTETIGISDLF